MKKTDVGCIGALLPGQYLLLKTRKGNLSGGQKKEGCCGARRPGREPPQTPVLRWPMKDEHVKDAAQGASEEVPQDVTQDLAFGARAARALVATPPPPPPPSLCSSR